MTSLEEPTLSGAYGRKDESGSRICMREIIINIFQKEKYIWDKSDKSIDKACRHMVIYGLKRKTTYYEGICYNDCSF